MLHLQEKRKKGERRYCTNRRETERVKRQRKGPQLDKEKGSTESRKKEELEERRATAREERQEQERGRQGGEKEKQQKGETAKDKMRKKDQKGMKKNEKEERRKKKAEKRRRQRKTLTREQESKPKRLQNSSLSQSECRKLGGRISGPHPLAFHSMSFQQLFGARSTDLQDRLSSLFKLGDDKDKKPHSQPFVEPQCTIFCFSF